jgi:hypothetical protein
MAERFNSKYNIGQSTAESIFRDLDKSLELLSTGKIVTSYNKLKMIRLKIPIKDSNLKMINKLKEIEYTFCKLVKLNNRVHLYNIIVLYIERLIYALDKNGMYLPSLKDMSNFT